MEEYNANKLSCENFGNGFSKILDEENIKEMHLQHMKMALHYSIMITRRAMISKLKNLYHRSLKLSAIRWV